MHLRIKVQRAAVSLPELDDALLQLLFSRNVIDFLLAKYTHWHRVFGVSQPPLLQGVEEEKDNDTGSFGRLRKQVGGHSRPNFIVRGTTMMTIIIVYV